MSTTAQFAAVPNIGRARISGVAAANTNREGTGTEGTNIFLLFTAGASGSRVDRIIYSACGTLVANTAGCIRVFISAAGGANKRLWREYPIATTTPSASAAGANNYSASTIDGGLSLAAGEQLWVTSHIADAAGNQFDIIAQGGNF